MGNLGSEDLGTMCSSHRMGKKVLKATACDGADNLDTEASHSFLSRCSERGVLKASWGE